MYSKRSPPGIQFEISWKGAMVVPNSGTIFGCVKRFHMTASWQNACDLRESMVNAEPITHFGNLLRAVLHIHPQTFDTNPRTIERSMVYIPKSSRSKRLGKNF